MPRILFITDNYPPEFNAPASRTFDHISEWRKENDLDITVITCFPNFPFGKVYKGYKNNLISIKNKDGIKLIRIWSYISKNEGTFKRIIDYFSFSLLAGFIGIFLKYDLIIATSPQFFTTWTACFLSKVKRKPWIFELRDLWPETIIAVNALKNKTILNLLENIELFLYKDCSKVIALTDSFKKNLIKRGISRKKIEVIKNGVNLNLFDRNSSSIKSDIFKKYKDKFLIAYIGTHGMTHGLDFVVNSIPKLKIKKLHFIFVGDGAMKLKIIKLAKKLSINNITFLDAVDKKLVPSYYFSVDSILVCLKKSETFKSVIPSKIFEACALRRPILLGVEGEANELVKSYNAGVTFIPENFSSFEESIIKITDKKNYKKCQIGCGHLAKEFNRKNLAAKMLTVIRDIIKKN